MGLYDPSHRFRAYLDEMKDFNEGKCWFCNKTQEDLKREFLEYMKDPDKNYESIDFDDLIIMTYKLKRPVCAGCYFAIKRSPEVIKEILEKPEEDVWS